MGQKVNPIGLRLGITRSWDSLWYTQSDYKEYLHQDLMIRRLIAERFKRAGIVKVIIERTPGKLSVSIHTVRPGLVIGQKGVRIEALKTDIKNKIAEPEVKEVRKAKPEYEKVNQKAKAKPSQRKKIDAPSIPISVHIGIIEVKKPETVAQIIADSIAQQIEQRVPFRRVMKQALRGAMRSALEGVKIIVSGRLNGADMARTEQYKDGRVPLHTLRANIEYAVSEAMTTYGLIGVKVWTYHGDVLPGKEDKKEDEYLVKPRSA